MNESHDIIDIGVNLAHRSFRADRKQVIERAFAAGVRSMIITGTNVAGSQEGVQIAGEYPARLFATAGVHPHHSRNCTETTLSELRHLATHKEVVAIGECGLDFNRDFSPRPQQEKWFEAQVALAEELQMPLFLHERDARQRFCDILAAGRKSVPAALHCFTGTREELKTYLDMGLHIGISQAQYRAWLAKVIERDLMYRPAAADRRAGWFILNYGWRAEEPEKPMKAWPCPLTMMLG